GHGERDLTATSGEGYSAVMQDLSSQNYEAKSISLMEEAKVPPFCSALMVLGPKKAFFPKEITALREYLDTGGRAFFALDPNVKGDTSSSPEIAEMLVDWYVVVPNNLVIDPASKVANVSPTVPLIGIYSKESPITRDFTGQNTSLFALTSTVDFKPGTPTTLTTFWLAKTTAYAFAKSNFAKELASGKIVKDPNKDVQGPNTVMAAVSGTRMGVAKPEKTPRIVVAGTSEFASNKLIKYGGNSDLMLNAISWLAGDESLISIRPKDESNDKATLSQVELSYSKFLTMLLLPGSSMFMGILVWRRRKRL
ncbi:MAG: Gldg family protein, partial [Deltaproteobacteria bacterium]|nr:Gldg family protein [Deltaproteobacteria bacterium]